MKRKLIYENGKEQVVRIIPDISSGGGGGSSDIRFNTKAAWDSEITLKSEENVLYVYTDYKTTGGKNVAGIKVGDGTSYLIDMPFTDKILYDHTANTVMHVTSTERAFWNNKVSAAYNAETLILSTN